MPKHYDDLAQCIVSVVEVGRRLGRAVFAKVVKVVPIPIQSVCQCDVFEMRLVHTTIIIMTERKSILSLRNGVTNHLNQLRSFCIVVKSKPRLD